MALTAMAASVATILSACGGDAETNGSDAPAEGGSVVTVAQSVDPTTMDPLQQRETTTVNVLRHIYSPLLRKNQEDPTTYDPALAESWELIDDTTYEFVLREDVTFSDGSVLNAEDVKYTIDYMLGDVTGDPTLFAQTVAGVTGAEVVDEFTVRLNLEAPNPLLLSSLPEVLIIPDGSVDEDPNALASEPIGSGPYTLETWDRNLQVVLEAREDYFGGAPNIDQVVFKTISDDAARVAGLNSGDIDVITNVSPSSIESVNASGAASVKETPSSRVASVWLNTLIDSPVQDPRVRRALNHAVDVQTIIDAAMSGYASRVATMTPSYFTGYNPDIAPLEYDPELAKELLAEAGYSDGFTMEMMLPAGRYPFAEDVSQAIQSYLAEVGVNMELNIVEFGVFADATNSGNVPEAFYAAWGNGPLNPIDEYLIAVRSGGSAYALFNDPSIDALVDEAAETMDQDQQDALITQIEEKLLEQAPFIFLYAYTDLYGVSERLEWQPQVDESIYMYDASIK